MATSNSPEYARIAAAFIAGAKVPASSKTRTGLQRLYAAFYGTNVFRPIHGTFPCLYSFGRHYPACIKIDYSNAPWEFLVNETDYALEDHERNEAGFQQSRYSSRKRPKFSLTTRRQLENIAMELRRAGKEPTDETVMLEDFTFRVWR